MATRGRSVLYYSTYTILYYSMGTFCLPKFNMRISRKYSRTSGNFWAACVWTSNCSVPSTLIITATDSWASKVSLEPQFFPTINEML